MNVIPGAKAKNYALRIEGILREIFGCERGGFMGVADADFIVRNLYAAVMAGLAYQCGQTNSYLKKGTSFLENFSYYMEFGLDGILAYDSETRSFKNGGSLEEEYSDADDLLEKLIVEFEQAIK